MSLRSWIEERRRDRAARRIVAELFRSPEILRGTSLEPRHAGRWILLGYEVGGAGMTGDHLAGGGVTGNDVTVKDATAGEVTVDDATVDDATVSEVTAGDATAGEVSSVRFGILRHPRPYAFSRQSHKVIEEYLWEVGPRRLSRVRGHNVTRAAGRDADD